MHSKYLYLIWFIFVSQLAGVIGAFFTISAIENWYLNLNKPFFTPPNWIFSPVWITLYVLMGVSAYLIHQSKSPSKQKNYALAVFYIHLIFNSVWSILFFGLKLLLLSFIDIAIILIFIVYLIYLYDRISTLASYLLYPYLIWVCYASLLNLAIMLIN